MSDLDLEPDAVQKIVTACLREARGLGSEVEFSKALGRSLADLRTTFAVGILVAKSQYRDLAKNDKTSLLAQNFESASDHVSHILQAITIICSSELHMERLPVLLEARRSDLVGFIETLKVNTDNQLGEFKSRFWATEVHVTSAEKRVGTKFLDLKKQLDAAKQAIKDISQKPVPHNPRSVRTVEDDRRTSDIEEGSGSLIVVRPGSTQDNHRRLKDLAESRSRSRTGQLPVKQRDVSRIKVLSPGDLLSTVQTPAESSASETVAIVADEGNPARLAWNVDKQEGRNNPSSNSRDKGGNPPTACELLFDCLRLNCGCPLPCGSTTPAA